MRAILLFVLIAFTGFSCSPIIYAPSTQHIPNLRGKGDVELEAAYIVTENTEGGSAAVAVAVGDQDGVGFSMNLMYGAEDDNDKGRLNSFELYYVRQGLISDNQKFMWGVAGGLGYTDTKWNSEYIGDFKSGYLRPNVLPSLGFVSRNFEVMISGRLSYVGYLSNNYNALSEEIANDFIENGNQVTFEPALTLRGGGKRVRVQMQYVYSTFRANLSDLYFYDISVFTMGLQVYLHGKRAN